MSHATKTANVRIASRFGTFGTELQCIILQNITQSLPEVKFDVNILNIPSNIRLADPQFNIPDIDIFIEAKKVWEIIMHRTNKIKKKLTSITKNIVRLGSSGFSRFN